MLKNIPGLFASVTDVQSEKLSDYISATGIPEIAFQPSTTQKVITPYGSFPLFLMNQTIGLIWYDNMLKGPRMQGRFGSTESITVNGSSIAPLTTWDSKITTVLAMVGGISQYTRMGLKQDGTYSRFYDVVQREWSNVFTSLKGENLPLALPSATIPANLNPPYFPNCRN